MTEPESHSIEPGVGGSSFSEYPAYGAPAPPPYGPAYVPQVPQAPYGAPYPPYGQPPQPPKKSRTGLIIGIVIGAVVLFLGVVVIVPLVFFGKMFSDIDKITADYNTNTEDILAKQLDVTFGTFTITHTDYSDDTSLPVTFKNKGSETKSFFVYVEAVDSDGDRIAEDTASAENLAPGQSTSTDMFAYGHDDDAAKLKNATFKVFKATASTE